MLFFLLINIALMAVITEKNKKIIESIQRVSVIPYIENIEKFGNSLKSERDADRLIVDLPEMANKCNVKVPVRKFEPFKSEYGIYKKLVFSIPVEGRYDDIRKFIYKIETLSRFIRIESLSLKKSGLESPDINIDIKAGAYYREQN